MSDVVYNIYCLIDPADNSIFYVGRTTQSLQNRLSGHLCCAIYNQSLKDKIDSIKKLGQVPKIELIETTNCKKREAQIIEELYRKYPLLNIQGYGRRHIPGTRSELLFSLPEKFVKAIKWGPFMAKYCPDVKNYKHKIRGKNGRGNPLEFSKEDIKQIKAGLRKMVQEGKLSLQIQG